MRLILTTCLLVLAALTTHSQIQKKVLIIGIDGVRSDALQFANTPNIDGLIANGFYCPDALSNDITVSGPAWSSILTGVWSDKHLVTGNGFSQDDFDNYPTIFGLLENQDPSINTASICHWSPINNNIIQGAADFMLNVSSDEALSAATVSYLSNSDPDCMFIHFDEVDGAGHGNGFSIDVPQYIAAIENVDLLIGPILTALENRPNYANEDWLILLTPDHGGIGTSHGGTTIDEQRVFFIASGDNVSTELLEATSTLIPDNPSNCLGEDIAQLDFDGDNDHVLIAPSSLFDFGSNQDFTIECRVRTNTAADVAMVGNKDWDSGFNPGFVFSFVFPSGPGWKVNLGDGSDRVDLNSGGSIADNEWHTLSVTFDRDGLMTMYEDGVFVDAGDISGIGNINTGEGLFFGTDFNLDYDFSGSIGEVRVWDSVLSAQEIQDWRCSAIDATHSSYGDLIGYWKMDEGVGTTTVVDASPFSNDGAIVDATWNEGEFITVFDYSGTPRIADIPVTALSHLCLELDPTWDLDGVSWIAPCQVAGCTGDFDTNGIVDITDLLFFLAEYGCSQDCGSVDIDNNGLVDVGDLLFFLSVFGNPCALQQEQLIIEDVQRPMIGRDRRALDHQVLSFGLQRCGPGDHVCKDLFD